MFEQERVIVRIQQRAQREAAILVCFVSGSIGKRVQDGLSDIDVAFVFRNEPARAAAYAGRRDFVRSILPYLPAKSFDADHIRPYFHIGLYSNGCKVDYRYEAMDELRPNPWDKEIRLLKDSDGWGETFQTQCALLAAPQPTITSEELAQLDERFWVMFWDTFRLAKRGDYRKAVPIYVELFDLTILRMMSLLPASSSEAQCLMTMRYSYDDETLPHLRQLFAAYLAARKTIITLFQLHFVSDNAFEREIGRLIERD